MGRLSNGTLFVNEFTPTGVTGEYSFLNATYNTQTDTDNLGVSAIESGWVLYIQALSLATGRPIPGVAHRYKLTSVSLDLDNQLVSGTILWAEAGAELDMPANGVDAIISQVSEKHLFGFPVSGDVYPSVPPGLPLYALNIDNQVITDAISGSGGGSGSDLTLGPAPDGSYSGGAVTLNPDQKISDAIDQINSLVGFLVPAAPPALNTLSPSVSGYTSYSANLSAGNSNTGPYTPGSTLLRVTKSPTPVLTFTNFGSADKGSLGVTVNSVEYPTFDLATAFLESNRNGNQGSGYGNASLPLTLTNSRLQIISVGRFNNFGAFQAGTASMNPQLSDAMSGYNTYQLVHNTGSVVERSQVYDLFFDATSTPTAGTLSVQLQTSSLKYLSGIPAYGAGSSIKVSMTSCQKAFANTYNTSGQWAQITSSAPTTIPSTTLLLTDTSASGISNPPSITDTPFFTNKIISLSASVTTDSPSWSVSILSPRGSSSPSTVNIPNFYINTFGNDSTSIQDTFVDETYRIPSGSGQYPALYSTVSLVNAASWDSTAHLASNELMLYKGSLKYANQSFANYQPVGPDYSSRSGIQSYLRKFSWPSATNAVLYITPNSLPSGLGLQIKLPGQTGWLNPLSPYLGGTPLNDGVGCLVGSTSVISSEIRIPVTFGTNSTVNSGNLLLVRVYWDNTVPASFGITKLRIAAS